MIDWLLPALEKGGTFAVAVFAIVAWYLERQDRVAISKALHDFTRSTVQGNSDALAGVNTALEVLKDRVTRARQ